jgi:RNA polymerase sigma factor (TIGR02999 family)
MESGRDLTELLHAWGDGDRGALDELIPKVYGELRRMARSRLRGERSDHTLGTTALVHEAYLRLVDIERVRFNDRGHFLATTSRIMRRILVDYANRRNALKRSGRKTELDDSVMSETVAEEFLWLDEALARLAQETPRHSEILEHRYFGGLSLEETAEALSLSLATVKRDLRFARAWLARELSANAVGARREGRGEES